MFKTEWYGHLFPLRLSSDTVQCLRQAHDKVETARCMQVKAVRSAINVIREHGIEFF